MSAEYVNALENGNRTHKRGDDLYALWVITGRDPPIAMAQGSIVL